MKELEFGSRSGPKTVVVLFAYGNVHPQTNTCLVRDVSKAAYVSGRADATNALAHGGATTPPMHPVARCWDIRYTPAPQDALVSRSRAVAAQRFLQDTDAEVLIMLDHDLWWVGPSQDYEGDLLHIARQCSQVQGIVGAAVSKKVRGQGIASMIREGGEYSFGLEPQLRQVWYLGAAFAAYHRRALEAVAAVTPSCTPGFRPMFMECVTTHPLDTAQKLHLSEDWAFCHYARQCGFESYLSCKPIVIHYGEYGFQVVRDALSPAEDVANIPAPTALPEQHYSHLNKTLAGQPVISCLHATRGRPELARAAHNLWLSRAAHPERIEYIFSADDDDPKMADWPAPDGTTLVTGPSRGCVDAYNRAYSKSHAPVLVQVHDDLEPPPGWDDQILQAIGDTQRPVALWVDDGANCNPSQPNLMTLAIGTRQFFDRLGGLFNPAYVSVWCDNDLTEAATRSNSKQDARHIKFKHHYQGPDRDETQKRSYRPENWEQGKAAFAKRWQA